MTQLVLLVNNECGVLARVTSIISSTSTNIQRCSVFAVPNSSLSILSFEVQASLEQAQAIRRKTTRLIQVLEVFCSADDPRQFPRNSELQLLNDLRACWEQVA